MKDNMKEAIDRSKAKIIGYKGDVLFFTGNPAFDENAYKFYNDGVLFVQNGKVLDVGYYLVLKSKYPNAEIVDYTGKLITPGFIDSHVHYGQMEMVAAYGEQLVQWLQKYTIPTERKLEDNDYAELIANIYLDDLIRNGTTTASVFATIASGSSDELFKASLKRNMRMIAGSAFMDENAPDYARLPAVQVYDFNSDLIKKWDNNGRLNYSVTPRSAYLLSEAEMEASSAVVKAFPGIRIQTHLAENKESGDMVQRMFPGVKDYTSVLDKYNLLTDKTTLGHCIWLSDEEFQLIEARGSTCAFLPTSNLFLGSGLFNLQKANKHGATVGLGTDYAAGTSLSMLKTMGEAYKVTQLRKAFVDDPSTIEVLSPLENFYLATLGAAKALSIDEYVGSFKVGMEADFIVLNPKATPAMEIRSKQNHSITDELFAFQIMGADRAVQHTYIMGKKMK
ncbi:guanine deaminase [Francisellaceae bacterium]|nr:guanine deaminase [Francisellaceae bacterium]